MVMEGLIPLSNAKREPSSIFIILLEISASTLKLQWVVCLKAGNGLHATILGSRHIMICAGIRGCVSRNNDLDFFWLGFMAHITKVMQRMRNNSILLHYRAVNRMV